MATHSEQREFGAGTLARVSARIYTLTVAGLLFALTTAPGLAVMALLGADTANLPLVALCALPVGPALSAVLYALDRHTGDLADLSPARTFWRGYRANARGVLALWVPLLAWVTVLGFNLVHAGAAGLGGWWRVPMTLLLVVALLWWANALVITTLFAFRVRDVARLAAYFLTARPSVPVGALAVLVVAAAITAAWSEAVLTLAVPLLALSLLRTAAPMTAEIRRRFVG